MDVIETTLALRPQPIGIFPLPAGYLVLPNGDAVADTQASLLGGQIPEQFPTAWRFYQLALDGQIEAALSALVQDHSPETLYNRFVLSGDPLLYAMLSETLQGELAQLLGVAAYTLGIAPSPPDVGLTSGELRAAILATQAAAALEAELPEQALRLLTEAVAAARPVSPIFTAQILADLAETQIAVQGVSAHSIQSLREAVQLLPSQGLEELRAHLHLRLGTLYQEMAGTQRAALLEAVRCYQESLRFYTRENRSDLYALAQNNIALAYLSMPLTEASDQLRGAIAVQALREALTVYTREHDPERWASTQLNLANALQYLPSGHPEEHLAEAVQQYEVLLETRSPAHDPQGYARILANQGNALAHLGIFDHAEIKLREAMELFQLGGEHDAATTVAQLRADVLAAAAAESETSHGSTPAPTV